MNIFDLFKIEALIDKKIQEVKKEILDSNLCNDLVTHINQSVSKRLIDIGNIEESKKIYEIQDHENKKYKRNEKLWAKNLDLTCISPWNSYGKNTRAGTAITRLHVIFATHYQIPAGSSIRFITKNNELVERKIIKSFSIKNTDFTIGLLDKELPESINPVKLLPKYWKEYMALDPKYLQNAGKLKPRISVLCLDQEEKATIAEIDSFYSNYKAVQCVKPENKILESFNELIVTGDSGNPCFAIVQDELVLITTWTYGGYGIGNFISGNVSTESGEECMLDVLQSSLYKELFNSGSSVSSIQLSYCDLWKFRRVCP